jgi:hypothetical protein
VNAGIILAGDVSQVVIRAPYADKVSTMDALGLFGLFAVTAMLVCYALEDRSAWFILAFAGACTLASIYGFLQGAWPFGIVEAIWAAVAVHRWRTRMPTVSA